MNSLDMIAIALNSNKAVHAGYSNQDAEVIGNVVRFTFPAPVISGACVSHIERLADGMIHDDDMDILRPGVREFLIDLDVSIKMAEY